MAFIFAIIFFVGALHALGALFSVYSPYRSRGHALATALIYGGLFAVSYHQMFSPDVAPRVAVAQPTAVPEQRESMSFVKCLASIRALGAQTGTTPTNIIETENLRVVRFPAADGSMLVTCNGIEGFRVINLSSKRCGVDVNC